MNLDEALKQLAESELDSLPKQHSERTAACPPIAGFLLADPKALGAYTEHVPHCAWCQKMLGWTAQERRADILDPTSWWGNLVDALFAQLPGPPQVVFAADGPALNGETTLGTIPGAIVRGGGHTLVHIDVVERPCLRSGFVVLVIQVRRLKPYFLPGERFKVTAAADQRRRLGPEHTITEEDAAEGREILLRFGVDPDLQKLWEGLDDLPLERLPLRLVLDSA